MPAPQSLLQRFASLRLAALAAAVAFIPGATGASPDGAVAAQAGASPLRPAVFEMSGRWIGNAVCFSPYRHGQAPRGAQPSDEEIYQDIRLVQRYWSLLRLYDSSPAVERTLRLIREHGVPVRVLLGCWLDADSVPANRASNEREASRAIRLANEYRDIVLAVSVGNETQVSWSAERSDPEALIRYIRRVRGAVPQPVSCADDYSYWKTADSRRISAELDFVMVNLYALWNGQPLDQAMKWTEGVCDDIRALHPGRPVVISETGWATRRDLTRTGPGGEATLMKAETSVAAQQEYLRQHYEWVNRSRVPTFLFEAFDESWKGGGAGSSPDEAEKHWGVFGEDRRPKASFEKIVETYYR